MEKINKEVQNKILENESYILNCDKNLPKITPIYPKKLKLEYNDLKIESEGYEASDLKDLLSILVKNNECDNLSMPTKTPIRNITKDTTPINIDGDVLEVSEALLKKARLPRTSKGFRCPSCGQSFITKYINSENTKSMYLFRNVLSKNTTLGHINIEGLTINEPMSIYKGLSKLTIEPVVLTYREGDICECPICNQSSPQTDWIDAYSHPLNYFKEEMLCDICGKPGNISVYAKDISVTQCEDKCAAKILNIENKKTEESETE